MITPSQVVATSEFPKSISATDFVRGPLDGPEHRRDGGRAYNSPAGYVTRQPASGEVAPNDGILRRVIVTPPAHPTATGGRR